MTDDQPSFVISVTRYGMPLVVGIFYLTASLGFEFTSDSAMHLASIVKYGFTSPLHDGYPSPLWHFLVSVGTVFHLDPLLTSKVLSLVFSCVTILASYLVANEILRDRLIAFCISLALAMQGWLLQLSPSGSALSLAIALTMAVLFFMLRNEYVVAPFCLGLCTLIYWQAVFLLIPLCVDVWINSVSKQRALKVILSACLVYLSALLPWAMYAWINNVEGTPVLLRVSELPNTSFIAMSVLVVLGVLGVVGLVLLQMARQSRKESVRVHSGVLLFVIVMTLQALILHVETWYAALPLVVTYAFLGLAEMLKRFGREQLLYSASFVLTGLLLVHLQFDYYGGNKSSMAAAIRQTNELRIAAEWIKVNTASGVDVCAENPGVLEYHAERPVALLSQNEEARCELVVTSRQEMQGYEVVFRPMMTADAATIPARHYAVWRKR